MANVKAEQHYKEGVSAVNANLDKIKSLIENYEKKLTFGDVILAENTERVHYGHAGDMFRVANDLQDIINYLG